MSDTPANSQTSAVPKGIPAKSSGEVEVYFHPGSATLLCVPAAEHEAFLSEQNLLTRSMEAVIKAKQEYELDADRAIEIRKTNIAQANTLLESAAEKVNNASEKLRDLLKTLTPDVEEGKLLSSGMSSAGIGLMELIPASKKGVMGFKKTYVRSDRISNHWRTYQLKDSEKKSGGKSFVKKETYTTEPDEHGRTEERTRLVVDHEKIVKAIKDTRPKMKLAGDDIKLMDDVNIIIGSWSKAMNTRLKKYLEPENEKFAQSGDVDLSVAAQLMRFSAGAGCNGEYNPLNKQLNGKVKGNASFVLGEAKCEKKWHYPSKAGSEFLYPCRVGVSESPANSTVSNPRLASLGAFKFVLTFGLTGSIGASIAVEAGITADWGSKTADGYGVKGSSARLRSGQNSHDISKAPVDADAGADLGVFAGAEIGANLAGSVEWKSPEDGKDFVKFAVIKPGLNAQVGAGASATFHLTYIRGRFRIFCKAALCWGGGAKGQIGLEINLAEIKTFFECFIMMLRNVDYQMMGNEIATSAYQSISSLPLIALSEGIYDSKAFYQRIGELIHEYQSPAKIFSALTDAISSAEKRRHLMEAINNNPGIFKYSTPETKGAAIALMIDVNFVDMIDPRNNAWNPTRADFYKISIMSLRKQAIFNALYWVQSKKDYENVMQHLNCDPTMAGTDWVYGQQKVIDFLGNGEFENLGFLSTQYARNLSSLYNDLRDGSEINPDSPLVHISDDKMSNYLSYIEKDKATQVAYMQSNLSTMIA
ncbi:hypothetical protein [Enterobacter cancerogenus]|uniref:hypothetical protein n=1 Tax=Enterobacter cancerogenus TaxID=69218 RepID=UPI000538EEBB|nr:hypothetical protein [Enterobacter cancerogenus]KGT89621.1 hypothetical protein NH00_13430 [Enterobacter cancerogenus]